MPRPGQAPLFYPVALLLLSSLYLCAADPQSPAEKKMAAAARLTQPQSYNDLAAALCERAAETGDISYLPHAEDALSHSPHDYASQKIHVAVLLGQHRWAEALESATVLNRRVPDDVTVWGLLADANFALGNYAESERATQWMFDLRSQTTAAFLPAARLRELSGDWEGALDYLDQAYRRTPDSESATRAALLTQSARLQFLNGNPKQGADLLAQALRLFPEYHEALKVLASTLKLQEAPEPLRIRYRGMKTTAALYDWAEALDRAGEKQEAAAAFRDFERRAQAESNGPFNANRELVFYYLDRRNDPAKALVIAEQERAVRHDIGTLDAYAWSLFHNGKIQQAKSQFEQILKSGTRDPQILSHAATVIRRRPG